MARAVSGPNVDVEAAAEVVLALLRGVDVPELFSHHHQHHHHIFNESFAPPRAQALHKALIREDARVGVDYRQLLRIIKAVARAEIAEAGGVQKEAPPAAAAPHTVPRGPFCRMPATLAFAMAIRGMSKERALIAQSGGTDADVVDTTTTASGGVEGDGHVGVSAAASQPHRHWDLVWQDAIALLPLLDLAVWRQVAIAMRVPTGVFRARNFRATLDAVPVVERELSRLVQLAAEVGLLHTGRGHPRYLRHSKGKHKHSRVKRRLDTSIAPVDPRDGVQGQPVQWRKTRSHKLAGVEAALISGIEDAAWFVGLARLHPFINIIPLVELMVGVPHLEGPLLRLVMTAPISGVEGAPEVSGMGRMFRRSLADRVVRSLMEHHQPQHAHTVLKAARLPAHRYPDVELAHQAKRIKQVLRVRNVLHVTWAQLCSVCFVGVVLVCYCGPSFRRTSRHACGLTWALSLLLGALQWLINNRKVTHEYVVRQLLSAPDVLPVAVNMLRTKHGRSHERVRWFYTLCVASICGVLYFVRPPAPLLLARLLACLLRQLLPLSQGRQALTLCPVFVAARAMSVCLLAAVPNV